MRDIRIILSITCFWLLVSAPPAGNAQVVQQRSNFTGKWVFDRSRSTWQPDRKLSRNLEIKHDEPKMAVIYRVDRDMQKREVRFVLFTDGRGETNKDEYGKYKSTTHWNGMQLERRYSRVVTINRQGPGIGEFMFVDLQVVELWELSDDGKILTVKGREKQNVQELMRQPPIDVIEFQWVYSRSS